jgi:hypothetical protein
VLVLVVIAAGCGGSGRPSATTAVAPRIPAVLGASLASRAHRISVALLRGDSCKAAAQADRLNGAIEQAVATGAIPRRLQAPALTAASRLAASIVCRPKSASATTSATSTSATTTQGPPTCAQLQARKQRFEQEKHALDQEKHYVDQTLKGPAKAARDKQIDARHHALDQEEQALDQRMHGCH